MSTNYYLAQHTGKKFHIGKSSGGWCFALHVYPELGIHDLDDWRARFERGVIVDEYDGYVAPGEMDTIIMDRSFQLGDISPKYWWGIHSWIGYRDEAHFHQRNHSERGPFGLLRHKVDGVHCIKHGQGTWDCLIREFS